MFIILLAICYLDTLLDVSVARRLESSCNTDFYCYYTKGCQDICERDETNRNKRNWRYNIIESSDNSKEMASSSGLDGLYRPRSALARALYEKQRNDRRLQEYDHNEWYRVDKTRLSAELQQKFVQLDPDEETREFLSASIEKSTWVWTQIWYLLAKAVLKHFWSVTDINGWLGRGSMFVLSEAQARTLLGTSPGNAGESAGAGAGAGAVVDVGAGDGEVSRRFAHLFETRYATEISASMRKALTHKGFTILDTDDWWRGQQFSCVSMLNLLDRCSKPITMLRQARTAITPGGSLLLALVLPYKPYVEVTPDHKPEERLPIHGITFEEQASSFVEFMSKELGFALKSWSRIPYLCEGDFSQAYYWLDDSIFVFTPSAIVPES